LTVALNRITEFTGIKAEPGATETVMAGMVMEAEADTDALVREVAVIVTLRSLDGAWAGAL